MVPRVIRVLLVEDSPSDAALLAESLNNGANGSFEITHVERLAQGLDHLTHERFDVVLLDLTLPDSKGRETFLRARSHSSNTPIVVMTGLDDEAAAVEALRMGIQDYLIKGQAFGRQTSKSIRYAIERQQMEMALQQERDQLETRVRDRTAELSQANSVLQTEITRRQKAEKAHKQVLSRLKESEETERARISRELHDRLGQDLTALKLGLRWLGKQCPFASIEQSTPTGAAAKAEIDCLTDELQTQLGLASGAVGPLIEQIQKECAYAGGVRDGLAKLEKIADGLMRDIHRLAWELHPAVLDDLGLATALRRYADDWAANTHVPVDLHCDGMETDRLPRALETALYRITQEALTNVARHAGAKRASVLLSRRADVVSLVIEDDGAGFDAAAVFQAHSKSGKLGLVGMRERVELAGGEFEVESNPGAGASILVRIPMEPKPAQA